MLSTQDPTDTGAGLLVINKHNAAGDLLAVTRNAGNGNVVTTVKYDSLGRKTSISDPDAGTTSFTYNAAGDVLTQKDAKNQTVTQFYDAMGRRWKRTTSGAVDGNNLTDQWTYDTAGLGLLASETRTPTNTATYGRTFSYDVYGRLYQRSTPFARHSYLE